MSTSIVNLLLDDRSNTIKLSYPFVAFFSMIFVVLRIWHDIRAKKHGYVNISDWLLALAQVCALVGTTFGYMSAWVGAGKHAWDPSVTEDDLKKYLEYLWFGQYFNLTAMTALKFSICAFMLQLDFSKTYRLLIWLTVAVHAGLNMVFPYIILFGECDPIARHWDLKLSGHCWDARPRMISAELLTGYLGAGSNIASDLFYACAPLIYIRKVQLPRRAMWGVRAVFLLGLVATIISAVKLYEIKALNESADVPYESVNLSILSVTEVFSLLNKILPESAASIRGNSHMNKYVLSNYGSNPRTKPGFDDGSSEQAIILPDPQGSAKKGHILRTTHVRMTVDVERTPHMGNHPNDWS
ncbi:hypothetical protein EJ07DRAFT_170203 [Lizonia empirigonia]|nr:hypothetical protein EJ07DRAFT_170203 [Lizonia empirigonia]